MRMAFIVFQVFAIVIFMTNGCDSEISQVKVRGMSSSSLIERGSINTYKKNDEIEVFIKAFNKAKKEPGVVDMADPEYKVVIGGESYYLWLSDESGTIMNLEDTHTIYTLSKNFVIELNELLK